MPVCSKKDQAIRELLALHPSIRDIEITGAALEDAFLELTSDPDADLATPLSHSAGIPS